MKGEITDSFQRRRDWSAGSWELVDICQTDTVKENKKDYNLARNRLINTINVINKTIITQLGAIVHKTTIERRSP